MAVPNLYSRRKRLADNAGRPEVYTYDDIPITLRNQIVHIWQELIGDTNNMWHGSIPRLIAKEHGLTHLPRVSREGGAFGHLSEYFTTASIEKALDVIEIVMWSSANFASFGEAVDEINQRMREAGVGYQYVSDQIVRVDSQYIHAEVVKQALSLMSGEPIFAGPEAEFLEAHEHYRYGRVESSIVESAKAFESTIKAICAARSWSYPPKGGAAVLMKTVFDNGLVPIYMESHMMGLPTLRNKTSGHGQGGTPVDVPGHLAAYALHMAAANIVMLVEAHKAKT